MAASMDFKVLNSKNLMSCSRQYDPSMKKRPAREVLAARVNELVGPGKKFASAPELAQRALTLGLIEKRDNFTRSINRIRKAEIDPQLNTIEAIADSCDVSITWLLGGLELMRNPVIENAIRVIEEGGPAAEAILINLQALLDVTRRRKDEITLKKQG